MICLVGDARFEIATPARLNVSTLGDFTYERLR